MNKSEEAFPKVREKRARRVLGRSLNRSCERMLKVKLWSAGGGPKIPTGFEWHTDLTVFNYAWAAGV
jgi:hypothetical protein